MARYRIVNGPVYVGSRRYEVGEILEHADEPSICMQPLDAAGRAAKLRAVIASEGACPVPGMSSGAIVPTRLGGNHRHRIKLAKSLGAGDLANYSAYDAFISNWIATQRAAEEA